jgi:hypothetical protein
MEECNKRFIKSKIKQRRRQMLVHSYIYYELNENIVSDAQWSRWAVELAELQKKYPKESAEVEYYEDFKDWDGSSGAFLNFGEDIKTVAKILLGIVSTGKQSMTKNSKSVSLGQYSEKKSQTKQLKSATRKLF